MTTYKPEFENKLNELGIKEAFERNREAQPNASKNFDINELDHWHAFVASAFMWHITEEGLDFWYEVSKK